MLDDAEKVKSIDKSDMFGTIAKFSKLIESGYKSAMKLDVEFKDCSNGIVFLGLGGSAIGGDIIRDWIGSHIPNGVRIERGFELSSPIDPKSLVICCSYSGNTKETLAMLDHSLKSGNKNILLISSDGELMKVAEKKKLQFIKLDSGMPPRTTLASVVSAISVLSDSVGWTKKASSEILAASESCGTFLKSNLALNVPEQKNLAKQLAHHLHGFIPVSIAPNCMESVARRWKTQMNENAKQHCFFGTFPEISHNEIVPWQRDIRSNAFTVLLLKGTHLNEQLMEGFEKFERVIKDSVKTISVSSFGKSKIEMLLNHVLIADSTSAYSAILSKVDPTPVEEIVQFKSIKN